MCFTQTSFCFDEALGDLHYDVDVVFVNDDDLGPMIGLALLPNSLYHDAKSKYYNIRI